MFSLCPLTVLPCSPLEQIDAAHAAGFDTVGLRLIPVMETDIAIMEDPALLAAIAQRLQQTGLKVLDVEVARYAPDLDVEALEPMLAFAGKVGARSLAVTGMAAAEYDPAFEPKIIEKLQALAKATAKHDIRVGLEFMKFRSMKTLADARRLRDLAGDPNIGIVLDTLHFCRSGGQIGDLAGLRAEELTCVQLCDAAAEAPADIAREARYGRLMPGRGGLPLVEIVKALPAGVAMAVEVPDAASQHLTAVEKAKIAFATARAVLAAAGR